MKAEEAIRALAFLSNPEELTKAPDNCLLEEIRDDDFGGGIRGRLTKGLTKLISEKALDLYSIPDKGNISNKEGVSSSRNNIQGTPSTSTPESDVGYFGECGNRAVYFGIVEVRKYPITIGANPSVSRGVPRTIEWDHLEEETERHHIDAYERDRPNEERKRGEELLLDGVTRAKMFQDLGYTKTQLLEGIRRVKEHKIGGSQRRQHRDQVSLRIGSK